MTILASERWEEFADGLRGRQVAVVSHPAAVDRAYRTTLEKCLRTCGRERVAIWSAEHGYWGVYQDMETFADDWDPWWRLPNLSLYREGAGLEPPAEAGTGVDVVLFEMQDVGARYYTYFHTLARILDRFSGTGVEVWVLDRPNPLGGRIREGPLLEPAYRSFVGSHPVPVRHGLTACEFALLYARDRGLDVDLRPILMKSWRRKMLWPQLHRDWVPPSPNMPAFITALVYPGLCLLEATNVSEGRGTTRPFEWFGAPWIDPFRLCRRLNELRLPGVVFRPHVFRPQARKYAGEACGGAQVHVTDPERFQPFFTGVLILRTLMELHPDRFAWREEPYEFVRDIPAIDLLCGTDRVRKALETGGDLDDLRREWAEAAVAWTERAADVFQYP